MHLKVMCESTHTCTGERELNCTRLAHTGGHQCFWCGLTWQDEPAESSAS